MTRAAPRYRGPNTWALAREAYLAGETVRSVAARLDLGFHGLKMRMRREGWTRRAAALAADAAAPPGPLWRTAPGHGGTARPRPSAPGPAPALAKAPAAETIAAELLRRALRQAAEALDDGRTADARTLSQMAESLSRTAARDPKTSLETILRALRDTAYRTELFRIDPDVKDDPDLPVKRAYWGLSGGGG